MPKVAQPLLDEFGKAVKLARAKRGWELNDLANRIAEMEAGRPGQKANPPGRSFLSDIEKGKRSISPPTVGKLIHALGLPESWLGRFLATAPNDADEVTAKDEDVDLFVRMAERDETLPPSAEGLLIGLAQSYAGGNYRDHFTAYTALKSALVMAQTDKAQGTLSSNTDSQFDSVVREVARLNDQGELQAAADLLDDEFSRASSAVETVVRRQLNQDRFLNRPKAAAERLIERLKRSARPGGVFKAALELSEDLRDLGERQGDPFDLSVALELAIHNLDRAKRPTEKNASLFVLALCQTAVGERSADDELLLESETNLRIALRSTPQKLNQRFWAAIQHSLGNALRILGDRRGDSARLTAAIEAYENALHEFSQDHDPLACAKVQNNLGIALQELGELKRSPSCLVASINALNQAQLELKRDCEPINWSISLNNLGLAHRWLGTLSNDPSQFDVARLAYEECLKGRSKELAPYLWATTQWNLADLALAGFDLTADRSLLETARHHVYAAREVFVLGSDHQTAECDRLLARINAA